jgi:hypothetical protein
MLHLAILETLSEVETMYRDAEVSTCNSCRKNTHSTFQFCHGKDKRCTRTPHFNPVMLKTRMHSTFQFCHGKGAHIHHISILLRWGHACIPHVNLVTSPCTHTHVASLRQNVHVTFTSTRYLLSHRWNMVQQYAKQFYCKYFFQSWLHLKCTYTHRHGPVQQIYP